MTTLLRLLPLWLRCGLVLHVWDDQRVCLNCGSVDRLQPRGKMITVRSSKE